MSESDNSTKAAIGVGVFMAVISIGLAGWVMNLQGDVARLNEILNGFDEKTKKLVEKAKESIAEETSKQVTQGRNLIISESHQQQNNVVNKGKKIAAAMSNIEIVKETGELSSETMSARASCSSGYKLVGGGCHIGVVWNSSMNHSYPYDETSWQCSAKHGYKGKEYALTAYAICLNTSSYE